MPVDYSLPYSGYGHEPFQVFTPTGAVSVSSGGELSLVDTVAIRVPTDTQCQIRFEDGSLSTQSITLTPRDPVGIGSNVAGFLFSGAVVVELMGGQGVHTGPPQPAWILADGTWNDAGVWVDTETWNDMAP